MISGRRADAGIADTTITSTRKVDDKLPNYLKMNRIATCDYQSSLCSLTQAHGKSMDDQEGVRAASRKMRLNRCYQCNGSFGLIRHKFAVKQFCSKACVAEYRANSEREIFRLKEWTNFLTRK